MMMENRLRDDSVTARIDVYSILRDIVRNLIVIILAASAAGMIAYMSAETKFRDTYSTKTTFVVTSKTSGNYSYSNLSAASTMADSFSNILNSSLLRKRVCEDMGISEFDATAEASVVSNTNLMNLSVTADTPEKAYKITRSIIKNITGLTEYVSSDMVVETLQEPQVPTKANERFSARDQVIRAFLITAALLIAAFAFLSYRKDTVRNEDEVETKLEARALGTIYHYGRKGLFKKKAQKLLVSELHAPFDLVENYNKIAARIQSRAERSEAKIILVTSSRENEGKSTVAANLALTLAKQQKEVLLVDGDLRGPSQNGIFLTRKEALSSTLGDYLEGRCKLNQALLYDRKRSLYLLLNDEAYGDSTELVSSERMTKLIDLVKQTFDFVIIDTPPMSLMADAEVLADLADLSILVVKYDTVTAQNINDDIDTLNSCRAAFAGCILNQVRTLPFMRGAVTGYGGYGGYGRYGRYGRYGKYGKYGHYGSTGEERSSEGQ